MPYGPATIPHLPPVWTGLYPYPKRSRQRWEIRHGAGTLDVSVRNARGLRWLFPDGTTSTEARPSKVVTAGTTLVTCDDFAADGVEIEVHNGTATLTPSELPDVRWYLRLNSGTNITGAFKDLPRVTNTLYLSTLSGLTGSVADLPRVTYYLYLNSLSGLTGSVADLPRVTNTLYLSTLSGLTGSVADLPRVTYYLYLNSLSGLTGSVADLPRVTNTLYLSTLSGLTGSVADLPRVTNTLYLISLSGLTGSVADLPRVTNFLYLQSVSGLTGDVDGLPANTGERRCYACVNVTGDLPVVSTNTPIYFYGNTAVSAAEYDQTIANCVAAGGTNRTLYISKRRTAASDPDKATLISRGWTVNDSNT